MGNDPDLGRRVKVHFASATHPWDSYKEGTLESGLDASSQGTCVELDDGTTIWVESSRITFID